MNDSWKTLLGALSALLIMYLLLYAPDSGEEISRPTSLDQGDNGYAGLRFWLEDSGVATLSARYRFNTISDDPSLAASGNLLITTLPHKNVMRSLEYQTLRRWIEQGNTLVVLAAINDSQFWSLQSGYGQVMDEVEAIAGIYFEIAMDAEGDGIVSGNAFEETPFTQEVLTGHPLTEGLRKLHYVSDSVSTIWRPTTVPHGNFALTLAVDEKHKVPTLWEVPLKEGRIILSSSSSLFSNRNLGRADNAALARNIVNWLVADAGFVIFDDYHQGLSNLYDSDAFFADARLHNTLWLILAFWLIYMVGTSARLTPAREKVTRSHQTDWVLAVGGMMARKLSQREAGRALIANWIAHMQLEKSTLMLSDSDMPWDEIESLHPSETDKLQELKTLYGSLGKGENINLSRLHNIIRQLERSRL